MAVNRVVMRMNLDRRDFHRFKYSEHNAKRIASRVSKRVKKIVVRSDTLLKLIASDSLE